MANYDLLPEEAFKALPQDTNRAFLQLVEEVEDAFNEHEGFEKTDQNQLRTDFAEQVVALAGELGIEGIVMPTSVQLPSTFSDFRSRLAGVKTRLRLRLRLASDAASVRLLPSTKVRIEFEIERLRETIEASDLADKKKAALNDKLDELVAELAKERVSLSAILKVAATIATILGGTTAALANAPEAVRTVLSIIEIVGDEKAHEDEQTPMLQPPPKALPAPTRTEDIA